MDNQDNLFNKIKSAAENAESKEFPSMEKVWSRIDAKLDTNVEKKNNTNWKVLLIAASVVLFVSIGYHFFNSNDRIEVPKNEMVTSSSKDSVTTKLKIDTNRVAIANPNIKEDANSILKNQIASQNQVTSSYSWSLPNDPKVVVTDSLTQSDEGIYANSKKAKSNWYGNQKFDSRSVIQKESTKMGYAVAVKDAKESDKKIEPLLIVDGEVAKKELSNLDDEEIESIVELKEPLYIINNVYYTEKELFGPNPTSPYSPLSKQKIVTLSVLQPEQAVAIYGEKGKKGIVIVTTKDGKPLPKKE